MRGKPLIKPLPNEINYSELWGLYAEGLVRIRKAMQFLMNENECNTSRINRAILALGCPNKQHFVDMSQYGGDGIVPLHDFCRLFGLNYHTIFGRMKTKCMTPAEAIDYGEAKKQKKELKKGRTDAKLRKQRAHLERVIEHLTTDALQQEQKYIG